MVNRFIDYVKETAARKGLTLLDIEAKTGYYRQFINQVSNNPVLRNRVDRLREIAKVLIEPHSKVMFLAGINPWQNRMPWHLQVVMWEFMERVVRAYEENNDPLPAQAYKDMARKIFNADEHIKKNMGKS